MFKNYLKIAWRNLIRNKTYSAINIVGLALGMAVALLISLWITDEVNYNKGFKNYDRLVRVMHNSTHGGETQTADALPIPLAAEMQAKYAADFKAVSLVSWNDPHILAFGDKQLSRSGIYAQPAFTGMFSLNMILGGPDGLSTPSSILLDQSLAASIFGDTDPIGKTLKIDNQNVVKVNGIYEDFPHNSEFRGVHCIMPWSQYLIDMPWIKYSEMKWDNNFFQLFAQLQPQADLAKVTAKVKPLLTGHDRVDKPEVVLHPMSKWNLYSEFWGGKNVGGSIQFVWMFGIIGLFVLLLACINFMNLSTARSERRAKEVGIRKAIGSLRSQLIGQFLGESLLITLLALVLSLALAAVALPWFNHVADKQMIVPWGKPLFWLLIIGFAIFTGLIAGSYPALYLSSFNSVKVLKGTFKAGRLASLPRKILVVLQFTVSVSLIIGTLVVFRQIQYARNRPMGYTREGLITIDMNTMDLFSNYDAIRHELMSTGAIANMAISGSPTTDMYAQQGGFLWPGKDPNLAPTFGVVSVTREFGNTVGWQVIDGRDFSTDFASDSTGLILNEAAVAYMGLKNPVGTTIKYLHSSYPNNDFRVVGVIRNMIMQSPFYPVKPTIFLMDSASNGMNVTTLKMNPRMSTAASLAQIAAVFKKYNPGSPFEYRFNDEEYAKKFSLEQRVASLTTLFAAFAIFNSCLGLFGLASFMAEQRSREIGIRKVLGASILSLWGLLSKEFLWLVSLSFVVAIPLSYYFMHNWLHRYAYRTPISAWIFLGTMGMALGITLLTVSFQSIRASMANPVRSLRTE